MLVEKMDRDWEGFYSWIDFVSFFNRSILGKNELRFKVFGKKLT